MPYMEILHKFAYQGIFACRIHFCNENSSKSYDFCEKCKKKNRKMISFGNFCPFFGVFTETLEHNIRKSHKKCFQMEKKTNK